MTKKSMMQGWKVAGVVVSLQSDYLDQYDAELAKRYLAEAIKLRPEDASHLVALNVYFEGDDALLDFQLKRLPFSRIRRITGYLSEVDRWNPGKQAELKDRVHHS